MLIDMGQQAIRANQSGQASQSVDVLIVGGGPAGLATAIATSQRKLRTLVIDQDAAYIDKACGEGLMPDAVEALGDLGIKIPYSQSFLCRGIEFISSGVSVKADFRDQAGVGMPRHALHRLLIQRAMNCGVSFLWKSNLNEVSGHTAVIGGRSAGDKAIEARWIIGADGCKSGVRTRAALDGAFFSSRRFGYRRRYHIAPWTEYTQVYWGSGFQVYVTPVGPAEVCVVVLARDSRMRLDAALRAFPDLENRLRSAAVSSGERGGICTMRLLRRVTRESFALVGDASGSVDAITGCGLALAFRQANALGAALAKRSLNEYESAHRKLILKPWLWAQMLLALSRSDLLREVMMRTLAKEPRMYARLLAAHTVS